MKQIKDFDALFAEWFEKWLAENAENYAGSDALEEAVPEVYAKWLAEPNPQTDNLPPERYFEGLPAEELVRLLKAYVEGGVPLSDVLCDTLAAAEGGEQALFAALTEGGAEELVTILMNMLNELDSSLPYEMYAGWVRDPGADACIRELAVEILSGSGAAASVADKLFDGLSYDNEDTKMLVADVAVTLEGDERAYRLLTELFASLDDVALCASYLGKFGDERALPLLKERIEDETINYAEFIELRNAIERLGGDVALTRSFEDDPYYRALAGTDAKKDGETPRS